MTAPQDFVAGPLPAPAVANLTPYRVPRPPQPIDLWLDRTEGDCRGDEVVSADALSRYPDARPLEAQLAAALGVPASGVLVTAGADEALDRACRAVLGPGRSIIVPTPTFEMLPRYARLAGARVIEVPWLAGDFPVAQVEAAIEPSTAAIAVVSPNNPTGLVARAQDLARLAAAAPTALLIVDLAYVEYAAEDLTPAVLALPNAVVVRSLSKAWGMAGLRLGYVAGPPGIINWLRTAGGPYAVASASLAVAARRLRDDGARVQQVRQVVQAARARLAQKLVDLGGEASPSQANFLLCRFRNAAWVRDALCGLGIATRHFPGVTLLADCLRITCPLAERDLARLEAALASALAPEALLFDLDGVLADVSASYRRAIIDTAQSFGVMLSGTEIALAKAHGNANNDWELTWRLVRAAGVQTSLDEVTSRFERLYQDEPGLWRHETLLIDQAELDRLAARLPLAIVTGRPRRDALRFLERVGVLGKFAAVICAEDAPAKPDPAPVELALRRLGVRRAWLVGDTPDDVRAARSAGVVALGFLPPYHAPNFDAALLTAGAARVLTHLSTLQELLP